MLQLIHDKDVEIMGVHGRPLEVRAGPDDYSGTDERAGGLFGWRRLLGWRAVSHEVASDTSEPAAARPMQYYIDRWTRQWEDARRPEPGFIPFGVTNVPEDCRVYAADPRLLLPEDHPERVQARESGTLLKTGGEQDIENIEWALGLLGDAPEQD